MPVPASYTETSFARYLMTVLDQVGVTLGWDVSDLVVQEAVTDALLDIDESTIANLTSSTELRRLRALGRRAIWRAVVQATADYYSITDNGQRLDRQQVNAQAREALALAEQACLLLGADPGYAVTVHRVSRPQDPYVVLPDDERLP